jgi:hypothetical protein
MTADEAHSIAQQFVERVAAAAAVSSTMEPERQLTVTEEAEARAAAEAAAAAEAERRARAEAEAKRRAAARAHATAAAKAKAEAESRQAALAALACPYRMSVMTWEEELDMEPQALIRKIAAAAELANEPDTADMLTLVADDGSVHPVARAAALRESALLEEMTAATDENTVSVPTSGPATAALAVYVRATPPAAAAAGPGGDGTAAAGGAVAAAAARAPPDLAFPTDDWRTAAFFMVARWMRMMAGAFGAAVCGAAGAAGNGGYAAIAAATRLTDMEAVLDPAVSPLLSMLPPEAVVALWCATVDARDESPVAEWAGAEMGSQQRQAQGWLVAGGDRDSGGELVQSSEGLAEHVRVVIRPGTAVIRQGAFEGCEGMVSVLIPPSVTRIGDRAFYGCEWMQWVAIPASVTQIGNFAFSGCSTLEAEGADERIMDSIRRCEYHGEYDVSEIAIAAAIQKYGDASEAADFCDICGMDRDYHSLHYLYDEEGEATGESFLLPCEQHLIP